MDQSVANSKKKKVVAALERRNFSRRNFERNFRRAESFEPKIRDENFEKFKEGMKI